MADNDVQVTFGADTSALTAGTTLAKGEVDRLIQSISLLQKTVGAAARATTAELTAAIQGAGSAASVAEPRVRAMAAAVGSLSTAGHSGHGTIFGMQSGVFLELRALLDEALAGRMRNFEGSFARLLGLLGPNIAGFVSLNPLLSASGVAAAVSAGYFAYLAVEMAKVREAQDDINRGHAFSGNFNIVDPAVLENTRRQLEGLKGIFKGIGESDVAKITTQFAQMGNVTNEVIGAMTADMTTFWKAFGEKEDEAAKKLVEVFSEPLAPIDKIAKSLNGLSESERKFISDAQAANNPIQAQAAIQQVIAQRSSQYHAQRIAQIDAEIAKDRERLANAAAGDATTRSVMQEEIERLEAERDAARKVDDALAGWAEKIRAAVTTSQMLGNEFRDLIDKANAVSDAVDRIGAETRKQGNQEGILTAGLQAAIQHDDVGEITRITAALKALHQESIVTGQKTSDPFGRDAMVKAEQDIKQWQATTGASQDAVRAHAAAIWKAMASDQNLSLAQQHDAYQKYLDAVISGNNAASKAGDKAAKDQLGATEQGIEGQIQAIERATQYATAHYEVELKLKQITEGQKAALVVAALQKEAAAIDALYAKELTLASLSQTKIAEIQNKEQAENDKVAEAMYEAQAKAAEKAQQAWQSATNTINSAFTSQVDGLLTGTERWHTAFKKVITSLTEDLLKSGLSRLLSGAENSIGSFAGVPGASSQAGLASIFTPLLAALGLNTVATTANTTATATASAASGGGGLFGFLGGLVPAFADGTPYVQSSGLALIHAGERIVPANLNSPEGLASMIGENRGASSAGAGGANVSVSPQTHFHVSAIDGASVSSWLRNNASDMAKHIHAASREGALLGLRRLQR